MNRESKLLFRHERDHLVRALCRDIRSERDKAMTNPEWKLYHLQNARMGVRVLEALGRKEDNCTN
jgi:hypothetical protein